MEPGFISAHLRKYLYILFCTIILLLAAGCSQPIAQTESYPDASKIPLLETTQTPERSKTTAATQTQPVSQTPTLKPTFNPTFTKTLTPSPVFTLTPVPRLPSDEALSSLMSIYSDNGGCELPCWWGITTGETPWTDVHNRLAPLGDLISTETSERVVLHEFQFVVPESIDPLGYFWPAILVENGMVKAISINSRWVMRGFDYSLAGLLNAFGQPEEIWLRIYPGTVATLPTYDIDLYYPKLGVDIGIHGKATRTGDTLTICPQDIFSLTEFAPGIFLWSPVDKIAFKDMSKSILTSMGDFENKDYHLLENFTNEFNEKSFYETYIDSRTNRCIQLDLMDVKDYLAYPPN